MFLTKDNKLGFIHIPKTGGTTVLDPFQQMLDLFSMLIPHIVALRLAYSRNQNNGLLLQEIRMKDIILGTTIN